MFRVSVISRRYFHDIRSYEVDAFETAQYGAKFARRPAASLRCAGCGCDFFYVSYGWDRIKCIDWEAWERECEERIG